MNGSRAVKPAAGQPAAPQSPSQSLAILGGTKVRTSPFPTWPVFGVEEEQRLLQALRSGKWGKLNRLPGIHPQKRPADCTRHSYHLFLLRIAAQAFGAPREAILRALQAEGIPICGGYALPLYRQPLFLNKSFGPYLPRAVARLDYGAVSCTNCKRICAEQGAWLEQSLFLGSQSDMDDIARAFEKVHENRGVLKQL